MMEIRLTELKDLPLVMEIYDYARAFMRANGNATQWIDGYPSESFIRQEIEDGHSFVCTDEQGEILGLSALYWAKILLISISTKVNGSMMNPTESFTGWLPAAKGKVYRMPV